MTAVMEAKGLGKRYGKHWALQDCSFGLPEGRIAALVGPNGAGKTTLLHCASGLLTPTTGSVSVLGEPQNGDSSLLARIGFVAQEMPMYRNFKVSEMIEFGAHCNPRWDSELAGTRLQKVGIPLDRKTENLSGGQRAQVALAVALAKRPELLLLDEPLASLDPLARRDFLRTLMESVAEDGTSVVLSSHLVTDLERVCDYLIILTSGRIRIAGDIEELLASHRVFTGPKRDHIVGVAEVIEQHGTERQTTAIVRLDGPVIDPAWSVSEVTLEELVLAYLGAPTSDEKRWLEAVNG